MSTTTSRKYVRRKSGAIYMEVSLREFDDLRLKRGLPYYKVSRGLVLVSLDDIDAWLQKFKVESARDVRVDELVEEVMDEFEIGKEE